MVTIVISVMLVEMAESLYVAISVQLPIIYNASKCDYGATILGTTILDYFSQFSNICYKVLHLFIKKTKFYKTYLSAILQWILQIFLMENGCVMLAVVLLKENFWIAKEMKKRKNLHWKY